MRATMKTVQKAAEVMKTNRRQEMLVSTVQRLHGRIHDQRVQDDISKPARSL